jgi:uncharacterized protein YkwD
MRTRPSGRRLPAALLAALFAALTMAVLAAPASAATSASQAESLIIGWMNRDRSAVGLRPLRPDTDLAIIAGGRAARMARANLMSHTISGSIPYQLSARHVRWYRYGENIAYSGRTWTLEAAQQIYAMWKASPSHHALMMSRYFNYVGVGLAYRSSNHRTFASTIFTESPDHTGARSWFTKATRSGHDLRWSWTGADVRLQTHTSGLRDFDIQYRVDSGSWLTLRNDTETTSVILAGRVSGHSYALRLRGTDQRGNIGGWSAPLPVWVP